MKNLRSNIIIGVLLLLVLIGVLWLLTRTPDLMSQLNTSKQPPVPAAAAKPVTKTPATPNAETPVPKPVDVPVETIMPPPANKPEPAVQPPPASKPIPIP